MVHQSVLNMEDEIVTLEGRDILTDSQRQLVLRISKMFESMCSELKAHKYEIVDRLETDEAAAQLRTGGV